MPGLQAGNSQPLFGKAVSEARENGGEAPATIKAQVLALRDEIDRKKTRILLIVSRIRRFVVTSLSADVVDARMLYEDYYCARGDMENRIKEQQLYLFADRTSTATMRANQLRLWFSSVAYTLLTALRRLGLKGTELAQAQCHTIRLRLLKLGAQIKVTVRKVWVSLAESYPYRLLFQRVYENLIRLIPMPLRC